MEETKSSQAESPKIEMIERSDGDNLASYNGINSEEGDKVERTTAKAWLCIGVRD